MKYHFFIKKYETVCHTHNYRACLKSLCYRRWELTPTIQHHMAWKLNWATLHGKWAREGFCPQEAKVWPIDNFFLTAALPWNTGLGLPDAWAVNKTARFTPSTDAQKIRWLSGSLPAFSCVKLRASQGSTRSRPYVLCHGSLLLSSLIRSCPEWPDTLVRLPRFVLT